MAGRAGEDPASWGGSSASPLDRCGKRVVFVSAVTGHGGPNASLRLLLPRLHDVDPILVGPYLDSEVLEWQAAGCHVERLPRPRGLRGLVSAMGRLFILLWRSRRPRPFVFANGLTEAAILAPSVLLLRLRGMVWVHNYAPPRVALACAPLLRRLGRSRLRLAAVSEVAAQVGREVFGPKAEIAPLPNPIERPTVSQFAGTEPAEVRRLRVAYMAGTDRRYKGFDLLPDIVAAADEAEVEWLIVAVEATQPEAWHKLREVVQKLDRSSVTIRGRTDRVDELYRWADVVLVPSRQESFCRVAAEAMAMGVAVVASALPAVEEVCGDLGFYFAPEDCQGAAELLRKLSESRALLETARTSGPRRMARLDPGDVAARLDALLNALTGGVDC